MCQIKIQCKLQRVWPPQSNQWRITMHLSLKCARPTQLIEETHERSLKPLWPTVNDRLLTFEQLLWLKANGQRYPYLPTSFQSLFSMFEERHFERDDPVFQFWRATAHKCDKIEELSCIWIRCWYVLIWFCRKHMVKLHVPANLPLMWSQQRSTLHSFQALSAFYWLHFLSGFILNLTLKSSSPFPLVHTILNKTPSLCPFRANSVTLQIQVRQSRVFLEAFGQGLTGEIWTSSPALQLIKL